MERPPIPQPLAIRARQARCGLEIGAGARFETALALAAANPGARWIVSDIYEPAAPPPLESLLLDATAPDVAGLPSIDLVYAVRLPEELQLAAARLARALGADLALRPLKDEWADISSVHRRSVAWPDGWRYFPASKEE